MHEIEPVPSKVITSSFQQTKLKDLLSARQYYTLIEEETTILHSKRTKIVFSSLSNPIPWSWHSPDIDSINTLYFQSNEEWLFTTLLKHGYDSSLIRYFAECENLNQKLKDPNLDDILIEKNHGQGKKGAEASNNWYYYLNGGNTIFNRILKLDPDFWLKILEACQKTAFLTLTEIHLRADCSNNLMKYISPSIQKGHYESSGLKVHGFYELNGKREHGPLGKRSSNFKTIKDQHLKIYNLYFGNREYVPISFLLYDKGDQIFETQGFIEDVGTRIELRINFQLAGAPKGEHSHREWVVESRSCLFELWSFYF